MFSQGFIFHSKRKNLLTGDFESTMTLMVASLYLHCAATLAVESRPRLTAREVSF
jgi:hypothetical protein